MTEAMAPIAAMVLIVVMSVVESLTSVMTDPGTGDGAHGTVIAENPITTAHRIADQIVPSEIAENVIQTHPRIPAVLDSLLESSAGEPCASTDQ